MNQLPEPLIKLDREAEVRKLIEGKPAYATLFESGGVSLGLWVLRGTDTQDSHDRDELYLVTSGSGRFRRQHQIVDFKSGDVLFVPAGAEHRFEQISDDFATWVVFFGSAD